MSERSHLFPHPPPHPPPPSPRAWLRPASGPAAASTAGSDHEIVHVLRRAQARGSSSVGPRPIVRGADLCVEKRRTQPDEPRADHVRASDPHFLCLGRRRPRTAQRRHHRHLQVETCPPLAPPADSQCPDRTATPMRGSTNRPLEAEITGRTKAPTQRGETPATRTPLEIGACRASIAFTRAERLAGEGPLYHHIGLYAFGLACCSPVSWRFFLRRSSNAKNSISARALNL